MKYLENTTLKLPDYSIGRHLTALVLIAVSIVLFIFRYPILREYVPFKIEVIGYLISGWPDDFIKPVLFQPIDWETAQKGMSFTFTNKYRGTKLVSLFFDNYNEGNKSPSTFIESIDFELLKSGEVVFKQSRTRWHFSIAYLLSGGRPAVTLTWIAPEHSFLDEPLELKIKVNGVTKEIEKYGQAYIGITNGSDY